MCRCGVRKMGLHFAVVSAQEQKACPSMTVQQPHRLHDGSMGRQTSGAVSCQIRESAHKCPTCIFMSAMTKLMSPYKGSMSGIMNFMSPLCTIMSGNNELHVAVVHNHVGNYEVHVAIVQNHVRNYVVYITMFPCRVMPGVTFASKCHPSDL